MKVVRVKVKKPNKNNVITHDIPQFVSEAKRIKWCLEHGILPDIKTNNAKKAKSSDFILIPSPVYKR